MAALLLATALVSPAMAQRPEPAPAWPDRYSGGPVLPGQVTAVDPGRGTVSVTTPSGTVTLESSAASGLRPGDRVDVHVVPSGPLVPGASESDAGVSARLLPSLPPAPPGAGLQEVPAAVSP
jgi:hypothetical protein